MRNARKGNIALVQTARIMILSQSHARAQQFLGPPGVSRWATGPVTGDYKPTCREHGFKSLEEIFGPHSSAQVAMVRGVYSNFRQVVFYEFDKKMDVPTLNSIIRSVEETGLRVSFMTCDQGNAYPL